MRPIIQVRNLSKQYRIGGKKAAYGTLRDSIAGALRNPFRRNGSEENTIWALRDVSFDVMPGEVVGIIGRNGAGKSTLLKILSRITEPTTGEIDIYGRVGSLLEVGTGFHQELSGRENIYLNGAVLGMKRSEIDRKFDEIVGFAEVEKFIDTPVKHYSSGMYMRLAFAVAAHLEPEILIIDEVLAVGDASFQKKCFGKIEGIAKEGRTVLFVSHDVRSIRALCESAIILHSGRMVKKLSVHQAVEKYFSIFSSEKTSLPAKSGDVILNFFDIKQNGLSVDHIDGSLPFEVVIHFSLLNDISLFRIGIYVKSLSGEVLLRSFHTDWNPNRENMKSGEHYATLIIPEKYFAAGNYIISLHASRYGIIDYFSDSNIARQINITSPIDYNLAHLSENIGSYMILKNEWDLNSNIMYFKADE